MPAPQATIEQIKAAAAKHYAGPLPLPDVFFFAVRGYWPKSMGPTPGNDLSVWDDAIFIVHGNNMFAERANTDPSRYGWNAGAGKPMASLMPGTWWFRPGAHKGHNPSFRQITEDEPQANLVPTTHFAVLRKTSSTDPGRQERGYFAINIHRGGAAGGTSSEGCQTVPRERADYFLGEAAHQMEMAKQKVIPYILVEGFTP